VAIALPLVTVLFQRGAFSAADAQNTALAVAVYGIGLPSFVLQKVLQPLFFAREDTKRPFYVALASMVVNAGIAIGLSPYIGFIAAAWGTTLAGWSSVVILWILSRKMGEAAQLDARFATRLPRIIGASLFMGVILVVCSRFLDDMLHQSGLRYLALLILVSIGIATYFIVVDRLGGLKLSELKRNMRRGK
jgi:putative peptidoglycan lipid II flippase